jgi:serine phosphatase RsbU (regulator of sigma subunit)
MVRWGLFVWCGCWAGSTLAQLSVPDSLQIVLEESNSLEEESQALIQLADYYEYRNLDTTYYFIQQALDAAEKADYSIGRANAYVRLSAYYAHYRRYKPDSLHRFLEQAITIYKEVGDSTQIAQAYYQVGRTAFYSDFYPIAFQYVTNAKDIYQQRNNRRALAEALSLLCEIQNRQGNNVIALSHCMEALEIFDELKIESEKARLNKTIGIINLDARNYPIARKHLIQAEDFAIQFRDTATLSTTYIGIGEVNIATENYEAALNDFQKVLNLNRDRAGNDMAYAYYNIGKTYLLQKQPKQAIPLLEEAIVLGERYENRLLQAQSSLELGKVYYELEELDQCFNYLNQCLTQAPRSIIGSSEVLRECYRQLARYYRKIGDLENALVSFGQYDLERKRAFQEETARLFAEMATIYETKDKDNQIELLQLENQYQSVLASERKLINLFLIVGLLVLFGVGVLLFSKYRVKARANQKLEVQKQKIEKQRDEITQKSKLLEESSRDIKDSIEYARRIQLSLLPEKDELKHVFPDSFVFHRPKDIVSGDFYWVYETENIILIAVLDCTGHGVPGAFMTVLANSVLNQVVQESKITSPNNILSIMDTRIREALRQSEAENTNTDGLDIAICMINRQSQEVCYSGAHIPLYFTHKGRLNKLEPSRYFIGGGRVKDKYFTNQCQLLQRGDMLYLASDGYQDQFGGPNDKKFMRGQFCKLLTSIQDLPTEDQYRKIKETFCSWQGKQIQTDDVLVVGFRL